MLILRVVAILIFLPFHIFIHIFLAQIIDFFKALKLISIYFNLLKAL